MVYTRARFKYKSKNLNGTVRCTKCNYLALTKNKVNATKNIFMNIKMTALKCATLKSLAKLKMKS